MSARPAPPTSAPGAPDAADRAAGRAYEFTGAETVEQLQALAERSEDRATRRRAASRLQERTGS